MMPSQAKEKTREYAKNYRERIGEEKFKTMRAAMARKYRASHLAQYQSWRDSQNGKLCHFRSQARKRSLEFSITTEDIMFFWKKDCFYCGGKIKNIGLDRVDNSEGYIRTNVVQCCLPCNRSKNDSTQSEFIARCKAVSKRFGGTE